MYTIIFNDFYRAEGAVYMKPSSSTLQTNPYTNLPYTPK